MNRRIWRLCLGLMVVAIAVHLVACRQDRPLALLSLGASAVVLACIGKSGVRADPARACSLALDPPDRDARPAGLPGEAPVGRSITALAVMVLGGTCVALTLAAAWVAYQAQARPGGMPLPQAREVRH